MQSWQVPSGVYVLPITLGATIKATARELALGSEKATPEALLYAEKADGFQCRSCEHATALNATHGRCAIMQGSISLDEGCCAAWGASKEKLHLYRDHFASVADSV